MGMSVGAVKASPSGGYLRMAHLRAASTGLVTSGLFGCRSVRWPSSGGWVSYPTQAVLSVAAAMRVAVRVKARASAWVRCGFLMDVGWVCMAWDCGWLGVGLCVWVVVGRVIGRV